MAGKLDDLQSIIGERYRLEQPLGRGGMSTVYAAFDPRHRRRVALKVLHQEFAAALGDDRFLREIEIAAQLQHPGIVALFDSYQSEKCLYYVMPLVEGESLRQRLAREGRLEVAEAVRLARQVAEALGYAHRKGVVHRDIKPENILLSGAHVLIADFGIGRAVDSAGRERLTETGFVVGTPEYMSPEQVAGASDVDGRSDIYSLGCVCYEMLVGEPPFRGPTTRATFAQRLTADLASLWEGRPEIPSALRQVVTKSLAVRPDDRYPTAEALLADLSVALGPVRASLENRPGSPASHPAVSRRRLVMAILALVTAGALGYGWWRQRETAGAAAGVRSLAVLPLANLSGDPAEEYFADGMTDALIGSLAQIRALTRVISLTSVMRYKGSRQSLPEIARELNVDAVIEGTVQRVGGRVRISARLIPRATDSPLWSSQYDRDERDVLKLQGEVARAVAQEIRVQITAEEQARLLSAHDIDPAAHEAFLLGHHHLRTNEADLRQAIGHFERAIRLEPGYAAAHASLSRAWQMRGVWGAVSRNAAAPLAAAAAMEAVGLDSLLPEAHLALSDVRIYEFDWGGAERELLRALELDPNSARAHQQRADLLMALERYDEAVVAIDRARTLDPFSSYIESRFARVLYRARRYHEALPHVERSIELDPNPGNAMPYWIKGELFNEIGRYEEAIANLERARNEGGRALDVDATIAGVYARMGNLTQARRIMAWLRRTNDPARLANAPVAYAYAALGEIDRAFDVLFRLVEDRQSYATQIKADPPLAKLHADPRWQMLLRKMNLATVSATSR